MRQEHEHHRNPQAIKVQICVWQAILHHSLPGTLSLVFYILNNEAKFPFYIRNN